MLHPGRNFRTISASFADPELMSGNNQYVQDRSLSFTKNSFISRKGYSRAAGDIPLTSKKIGVYAKVGTSRRFFGSSCIAYTWTGSGPNSLCLIFGMENPA